MRDMRLQASDIDDGLCKTLQDVPIPIPSRGSVQRRPKRSLGATHDAKCQLHKGRLRFGAAKRWVGWIFDFAGVRGMQAVCCTSGAITVNGSSLAR